MYGVEGLDDRWQKLLFRSVCSQTRIAGYTPQQILDSIISSEDHGMTADDIQDIVDTFDTVCKGCRHSNTFDDRCIACIDTNCFDPDTRGRAPYA